VATAGITTNDRGRADALWELVKLPVCAASSLTVASGYIAFRHDVDRGLFGAVSGTLLLAMAASALNEVQERDVDALMARTRNRPVACRQIGVVPATALAVAVGIAGFLILLTGQGSTPALLGLLAVGVYNGVYTPMKRVSAFAIVPGSLIGALPPAIGWIAAGGSGGDPALLAICLLLVVWQMPHFWLLSIVHQADYARAGLPTLGGHFQQSQIRRLIFTWTCGTVAAAALLPAFGTSGGIGAVILMTGGGIWLVARSVWLVRRRGECAHFRRAFVDINRFVALVMATMILDALGLR
jgi:heme o synthase